MSQPRQNANTSRRQGQRQNQGGVRDGRIRKSKSQEPLGNRPSSLSQTGRMRSRPTQSASGLQPITTQLPVAQARDDEPEWQDAGEDSMDSQDEEYDDDGSSEESMEEDAEDAEDAEDDPLFGLGAQRPIERGYEFVESQPSVISPSDTPTGRSDIRIGLPGRTTPAPRASRSRFTMLTNSSGDASPAESSIIPTATGPIPAAMQHEQRASSRSRRNNAVGVELTIQNKARDLMWDLALFQDPFPDPIRLTEQVHQCWSDAQRILGLSNFPDATPHSSDQVSPLGKL
jgi:hypothetical protein